MNFTFLFLVACAFCKKLVVYQNAWDSELYKKLAEFAEETGTLEIVNCDTYKDLRFTVENFDVFGVIVPGVGNIEFSVDLDLSRASIYIAFVSNIEDYTRKYLGFTEEEQKNMDKLHVFNFCDDILGFLRDEF